MTEVERASTVIEAAMWLHNFIIDNNLDVQPEREINDTAEEC